MGGSAGRKARTTSLRALARRLGVSDMAVRKAVKSGRLSRSVGRGARGQPTIVDVDLALREWRQEASQATPDRGHAPPELGADPPGEPMTLTEVQKRVGLERARGLELKNRLTAGELTTVASARRAAFEAGRVLRDNVQNVPDRIASQLAGLSDVAQVHELLSSELRQALETTAEALEESARGLEEDAGAA